MRKRHILFRLATARHHAMSTFPRSLLLPSLASLLALMVPSQAAQVLWGSARLASNYLSSGSPAALGGDFTFQLGTFTDDFQPTAENTDQWLDHWVPAQSTRYNEHTRFFTGSYVYQEPASPFLPNQKGYIFGFNRWAVSEGGDRAEWILASDPSWRWPAGGPIAPPVQWSMSKASNVILGSIGDSASSFHMKTANIATPIKLLSDDLWAKRFLGASDAQTLAADPDHDGLSNRMEAIFSTDPFSPDQGRYPTMAVVNHDGIKVIELAFFKFGQAKGTELQVEASTDLVQWRRADDAFEVVEDSLLVYRVRSTQPVATLGSHYHRLVVVEKPAE